MNTRKNQSTMTPAEKTAFVSAVVKLKTAVPSQIGLTNRYDDYVQIHMDSMMLPDGNDRVPGWAHRAPAFGPWHRALLRNFEVDLQQAANDPTLSLPYWDWTVDNSSGSGPRSPWTNDFMGKMDPATDTVTSGPFRQGVWTLNVLEPQDTGTSLKRALGRAGFQPSSPPFPITTLPTVLNVKNALLETPYDIAPWQSGDTPSFRDRLEGWHGAGSIHNRVHLWVSGSMLPSTSPNDPIFFLHHCNIDRLWAHWQHPAGSAARPYVPSAGAANAPIGHRLGDPMQPWGGAVTVDSTLDHRSMGYRYDDEAAPAGHFLVAPPVTAPSTTAPSLVFPQWQHKVQKHHHHRPMMMFDISPEDKMAGGHDING